MKRKVYTGFVSVFIIFVISLFFLSGCSQMSQMFVSMKGSLVGNSYKIWEYDNFGNRVMTLNGNKITMDGNVDSNGNLTSYMNITIDGNEWNHVGNTLIFVQDGVDLVTDFEIPDEVSTESGSTGFMPADRLINSYRNSFGKDSIVVVSSQLGVPICVFQGDDCYVKESENLPKTTEIYIDDHLVYVHRANIDIFPTEMFTK